MKSQNKITGNIGEELATEYLEKKGYKIKERNFRTRFGEIDIICWDGKILVFVEVKTKIGHDFGEPEEMVNKSKIGKVKKMGEVYLQDKGLDVLCRVDVVAIVMQNSESVERIEHYQALY
ncbi:MAG TPA: YraN family protein [Candidatus Woesebacteria bacterium]|nr:YraN family protein [Candidatus Woesebacteria bacterium]